MDLVCGDESYLGPVDHRCSLRHYHPDSLVRKAALLKRNALAAPFEQAFAAQQAGQQSNLMVVHYREQEAIYIQSQPDRVTVIFSTIFQEETDRVFGKVFLQEFVDARRQLNIQSAPQVLYTYREPPMELRGLRGLVDSDSMGYVTFGMCWRWMPLYGSQKAD